MSGFFTLGGKDQEHNQQNQEITTTNNSLFVFKNEEIYNKGFELWQQYYQLHHQQKLQLQDMDLSLMASGSSSSRGRTSNTIVYGTTDDQSVLYRSSSSGFGLMRPSGSNVGTINCQDCGNQAKKDCIHMRCRTCCKSRGFQCQTHVKSTWVPAAKRRERQQQLHLSSSNLQHHHNQEQQNQQQQQLTLTRGGENPKRQRENPLTKSGLEVGQHFPAEVSSQALFRCVNVRPMGDEEELYAYQTAVNIGGHVFKGLLYDQGPESRYGESSSGGGGGDQQPHNLITAATTAPSSNPTNMTWLEPSIYPAPLNAFMAGTQFFPPPRP